jgi:hypothetical protein
MPRFSMQTEIAIVIASGREHLFDVLVDYEFSPGMAAYTPPGEYAPIDPPEPADAEVVAARWRDCDADEHIKYQDCPGWLISMLSDDDDLRRSLIDDAESNQGPDPDYLYEMRRDEPDEAQEWRDYDPDC